MVRPVTQTRVELRGTIEDRVMMMCDARDISPWALIVYVKTASSLHAVLVPVLERVESAARFASFLQDNGQSIEATEVQFEPEQWSTRQSTTLYWPKSGDVSL